jgi:hypothetical protein
MIDTTETERQVRAFVDGAPHVFWSVSNVGDMLITLAAAMQYPDARLVHCGRDSLTDNKDQWYTFLAHWPAYFNIPFLYVADKDGRMMQAVERIMLTLPNYHPVIAPRIVERKGYAFRDPENGRDWQTLHPRIVTQTDWSERIGTTSLFPNAKLCIICPSGSKKRRKWQRYFSYGELQTIVTLARDRGYTVVITSHETDYLQYKMPHVYWLTHDTLIDLDGTRRPVSFEEFLQILNSGQYYISMDTWLKTFVALLGKPVQMVRRRSYGQYVEFGSDPADHIFLDRRLWPDMHLVTVEEVCADLAQH